MKRNTRQKVLTREQFHSFDKYLLSICYVLGTVPDSGDIVANPTDYNPSPYRDYVLVEGDR